MKIKSLLFISLIPVLLYGCGSSKKIQALNPPRIIDTVSATINDTTVNNIIPETDNSKTDPFLVNLLKEYPQYFDSILKNKKAWNIQDFKSECWMVESSVAFKMDIITQKI
jgi:hypothetical protein